MAFLDTVKSGITNAVDTVSEVTQSLIEKNRANAQLNRLRAVMKSECEMINRAYIALGKNYYENKINGKAEDCPEEEELFAVIEQSKANIKKARERYRQVMESQTVEVITEYDITDLEDITVSCSNEDEYEASPFVQAEEKDAESVVEDVIETVKKNAEEMADKVEDAVAQLDEEVEEIAEDAQDLF